MELAKIGDRNENQIVKDLVWRHAGRGRNQIFIGGNDLRKEGKWNWADGSPMYYKYFSGGEPNNYMGREDCATIAENQKWNDVGCKMELRYLCEKRKTAELEKVTFKKWEYNMVK